MESIVLATGVTRLVLISGVLLVNCVSLVRLFCCCSRPRQCVHTVTTGIVIICSVSYLVSWLPYLTFSLPDGRWPMINAKEHCVIQQSVTGQVTTILLAVLAIRKLYDCFRPKTAKILSYSAVIAWIIPQLIYLSLVEIFNSDKSSYRFLDRLLLVPHSSNPNSTQFTIGFMLCVHHLAAPVVTQLSWHYVVLVIPLTALILFCFVGEAMKKFSGSGSPESCRCNADLLVSLCLYFNLTWLLIIRPLIVLQTLMWKRGSLQSPTYLDFGTHLVLIFAAVFVPFALHGGLRRSLDKIVAIKEPHSIGLSNNRTVIAVDFDRY